MMNYKRIILATIVGAIAMFFAGWLIWGMLLEPFQQGHTVQYDGLKKDMPNMPLMFLSMVISAFMYAYIYERWANISTFKTGAMAGALLSVLIGLSMEVFQLSYFNLADEVVLLTNVLGNLVYGAIAGGVIGWLLGRMK